MCLIWTPSMHIINVACHAQSHTQSHATTGPNRVVSSFSSLVVSFVCTGWGTYPGACCRSVLREQAPSCVLALRVKISEYVHSWFEFLCVSLLLIFNFFPPINHFYYFTSLHGLQDVLNMLHINTQLSVPHGQNIKKTVIYI